ncbi:7900_t:CDS:2, partial [Funneliformis geosporum]
FNLDSVGTSNKGLNTMANISMSTTSRSIDRKKKKCLIRMANITSWVTHIAMIMVNLYTISAIPRNGTINPKIIDAKLITRHLEERFIVNLGVSY